MYGAKLLLNLATLALQQLFPTQILLIFQRIKLTATERYIPMLQTSNLVHVVLLIFRKCKVLNLRVGRSRDPKGLLFTKTEVNKNCFSIKYQTSEYFWSKLG